jgi:hypothetical protein
MRRPIRPFVKEYKSRSAKPAPRAGGEDATLEPTPRFLDAPPPAAARIREADDTYEAAMKAADLVFGKKAPSPVALLVDVAPPPPAEPALAEETVLIVAEAAPIEAPAPRPMGRILPSLIEVEFTPAREPEPPARKRGRPRKVVAVPAAPPPTDEPEAPVIERAPRKASRPAAKAAPRPIFAEIAAPIVTPDAELDDEDDDALPASPRPARRIQARWVRRTELMAGEKWKRRLPQPGRPR